MIPEISFRGIIPILGPDMFQAEVIAALQGEMDTSKRIIMKVHQGWKEEDQPAWDTQVGIKGKSLMGVLMTISNYEVISHQNYGAKAHFIYATNKPYLRYQRQHRRKTHKRQFRSGPGGKYGEWVRRKVVKHPGNEANEWDIELARLRQPFFTKAIGSALLRGANKFFTGSRTTR